MKIVAVNKKAFFNYEIIDKYDAGIVLKGWEVKSLRNKKVQINDAFAKFHNNELYITNMHIQPLKYSDVDEYETSRPKKLLLKKRELKKLIGKLKIKGYTLIPLKVYFPNAYAKIELALATGKKQYDKRETIKKRELDRELNRKYKYR